MHGSCRTTEISSSLPALASSTGVGLWRLNSSVCHIDVISLTYNSRKNYSCFELFKGIIIEVNISKRLRPDLLSAYLDLHGQDQFDH